MARPALRRALFALTATTILLAGCNGQVINFRSDAGTGTGTGTPTAGDTGGLIVSGSVTSPGGATLRTTVIDKIDILFDIDNSASMGDKQAYLQAAIPDLVNRLINPNCINPATNASDGPSNAGLCPNPADRPEFTPVHDMHLGIISSSLGPRGGDACAPQAMAPPPFSNVLANDDDQAHLLNRSLTFSANGNTVTQGIVQDAPASDPFLYWFPVAANMGETAGPGSPIMNGTALISDFTELVGGAGTFGCGIESQLESWYRFLVQPDPYQSISLRGSIANGTGSWNGVDATILQERHDFLRPDSFVVIVVLSDENDSEIDVRSIGGLGVNWMAGAFQPPKSTAICATSPGSPECQSCAQGNNASTDGNCMNGGSTYTAVNDWGYDLNLRHVHMKAKYGIDPQYPIERYVTGLTSTTVPDRNGEYPSGASAYQGMNDCQNPLFAGNLPNGSQVTVDALCHTPAGPRTKDQVLFAHIGGVPSSLLHFKAGDPAGSALSSADWVKILGNDPENYDYSGIDPHMIESYSPRSNLPPPGSANNADPTTGHEWITNTGAGHVTAVDLEYACTFALVNAQGTPTQRDCTQAQNADACDCPHLAGSLNAEELPPICDPMVQTSQIGAKAYPTVRELLLAKKLGSQGVVSSICPIDVADNAAGNDPLYGYRPAVSLIVDHMEAAIGKEQCLPAPLSDAAHCSLLLQVPDGAAGTFGSCMNPGCPPSAGLQTPDQDTLTSLCQNLESAYQQQVDGSGGNTVGFVDPASVPVCELHQLVDNAALNQDVALDFQGGSCANSRDAGWCYVTGGSAGVCSQSIVFSLGSVPNGAIARLVCP